MFGSDHWALILLVLLVALVIFGPKRLPELGHSLGRAINEFRHATQSGIGEDHPAAPSPEPPGASSAEVPATDRVVGAAPSGSDPGRQS